MCLFNKYILLYSSYNFNIYIFQCSSVCSTRDLPAEPGSLDCRVDNKPTESDEISEGGSCKFLCETSLVTSWKQCHSGQWQGGNTNCEASDKLAAIKLLRRKKKPKFIEHRRRKRGWGKDLICWIFGCGVPADRQRPQITGCPSDIHVTADPIQTHTKVSWKEPTAYDNRDGRITPVRHGLAPGRLFSEPFTIMRYTAQDRAGNMATCSFKINVHVIRCAPAPPKVSDGYRICHLSTDYRLGSVCWYGCYEGHELIGSSTNIIKCLKTGEWSAPFPFCKKKECPPLRAPSGMELQCSDNWKFRSICSFSCTQPGYDIPPGKRRSHVCQANKRWSGQRVRCKDMERPKFAPYPRVITAFADRGSNSTRVTFIKPEVVDNSPKTVIPKQVKGHTSGSSFSVGVHLIEFHAADSSGNEAKPLKIKIVVKELVCHTLYRTPYQSILCEQGYRYGSPCYFFCDQDFVLVGTANVTCEKMGNPPYGAWTFGNTQPTCTVAKQCPVLRAPDNGAMVCDTWFGGQFCQLMCRNGTDVPRSFPNWQLFQCGTSGIWNIKDYDLADKIPNCIKPRRAQKVKYRMMLNYYFNGDCQSKETLEEIKKKFLSELGTTGQIDCSLYKKCTMENVKVVCGASTRRKRATDAGSRELSIEVTFSFDIKNVDDNSEINAWVADVMNGVKKAVNSTEQGRNLTFVSMENGNLTISCPSGHLPNYRTFKCDPCDKGSFHNLSSNMCVLCAKGKFQNSEGKTACQRCPSGKTTVSKGSTDLASCQMACQAGYMSRTGVVPCSPCELSTYQPEQGQSTCIACPGSMTTTSQGTATVSGCTEFDLDFEPSNTSDSQVSLETVDLHLENRFVISWWIRTNYSEKKKITTFLDDNQGEWLVISVKNSSYITVNSEEYNTRVNITDEFWHFLKIDINRTSCLVSVDGEVGIRKELTWMKENKNVSRVVIGGNSFSGSVSQFNIWSDMSLLPSSPTCRSDKTGDKLPWRKFVTANLTESAVSYPSECDDFNNCLSSPCYHGNCTDDLNSYNCQCDPGYEGDQCETDIDNCLENMCENNGTCIDQVGGFKCACSDVFTGELCEIAVIHGSWAEWEDWSTCSVSCGVGIRTRKRSCTDPSPDNGGRECDGSDTEQDICNETACPFCKEIAAPSNGFLPCENSTELFNCTFGCDDGFMPDIPALSSYYCGKETAYVWNFETKENPHRRLPFCSKIHTANEISATYHVKYKDLHCGENEAARSIVSQLVKTVVQSDIECVKDAKCSVDDINVGCSETEQQKRDVSENNMGFTVTLKNKVVRAESAALLESAMRRLQENAEVGSFTIDIGGISYYVEVNQSDVVGDVSCSEGMISYSYFCIPCGQGSFASLNACVLCGRGSYQNKTGQTQCEQCPDGWTTDSTGSRDISDCYVKQLSNPASTNITVIAVSVSVPFLLISIVIITFLLVRNFTRRKAVTRPNTPANELNELPAISYPVKPVVDENFRKLEHRKTAWENFETKTLHYEDKVSLPNVHSETHLN